MNDALEKQARYAFERIIDLLEWHHDPGAKIDDPSPEDMHAHVNGLVIRECRIMLARLARQHVVLDE
jgi:hypothetical protein